MNAGFVFPLHHIYLWGGLALLVLTGLGIALGLLERRRAHRLERVIDLELAPRLLSGVYARLRRPLYWFALAGFALLAFALMQPHWGQSYQEVSRRSHDILVLLDVSESMLAENPAPSRLARAKQKIATISERAYGDRFGLIAFSGAAELMCPLTLDHAYFRTVLSAVDTDSISLEGTDIERALLAARDVLAEQAEDAEANPGRDSRAVLLISDGEAVSGQAVAAAREVGEYAHVFVIGVGDPRGAEVTYTNRFVRGSVQKETHLSRLDEDKLQDIALAGGGGYIRSTASNRDVDEIAGLVDQLFARGVESDVEERLVNRYQWPLALAIAFFMLEGLWLVLMPWMSTAQDRRESAGEELEYA